MNTGGFQKPSCVACLARINLLSLAVTFEVAPEGNRMRLVGPERIGSPGVRVICRLCLSEIASAVLRGENS